MTTWRDWPEAVRDWFVRLAGRVREAVDLDVWTVLRVVLVVAAVVPPLWVAVYRVLPIGTTPMLAIRLANGEGLVRVPVPYAQISPDLVRAVIASEDQRFCSHHGFDWKAIDRANTHNETSARLRGASTLSMQVAKNVFLWQDRSWLRKGLEAYFTFFIEAFWSKEKILVTYLNVAEWGPGIYGAEAAARYHFGTSAKALTTDQAARLAVILPSPKKWRAEPPGPYVASRAAVIEERMRTVARDKLDACVRESGAKAGDPL